MVSDCTVTYSKTMFNELVGTLKMTSLSVLLMMFNIDNNVNFSYYKSDG